MHSKLTLSVPLMPDEFTTDYCARLALRNFRSASAFALDMGFTFPDHRGRIADRDRQAFGSQRRAAGIARRKQPALDENRSLSYEGAGSGSADFSPWSLRRLSGVFQGRHRNLRPARGSGSATSDALGDRFRTNLREAPHRSAETRRYFRQERQAQLVGHCGLDRA